ncbi:hypothetical protein BH09VER1_BH09VER1_36550 [soil metagenome]
MSDSPLSLLFDTSDYPARWHCGNWTSLAGWTHIIADLAIFGAYAAIPLSITYFVWKRRDIQLPALWWLFAAFIFSCGFTHLVEASLFWHPWYRLSGLLKVITALVSWATVIAIYRSLPTLTTLPGLAQLNSRLRRSEEKLAITLNSIGDAVMATDAAGRITRMNPVAETLTGWKQEETVGKLVEEVVCIVDEDTREPATIPVREVLETKRTMAMASGSVLIARTGESHIIDNSASPILDMEGEVLGVVLVFRDVTNERQRVAEERSRMAKSLEFQSILLEIRSRESEEQTAFLRCVTERVAQALGSERAGVWFFNEDRTKISCAELFLRSPKTHERGQQLSVGDFPEYFRKITGNEPVIADEALTHSATQVLAESYLKPLGIVSMLDVPIREGAEPVGVICSEHVEPHKWTLEESEFVTSVAGIVEVSRENAKRRAAEAEVRRLNQNLERLVAERTNELSAQKELMARLLENLTDGVVACDAEGHLSFFNRVAREWHGADILKVPREKWPELFDLFDGEGKTHLSAESVPLARAFCGESVRNSPMSILARGQAPRSLVVNGDPLYNEAGEKVGAVVVMHDVTEEKRAQEALRLSGERAELAADAGKVGIWDLEVGMGKLDWNDQMYAMYGVSRETTRPEYALWYTSVHPDDRERAAGALKLAQQDLGHPFDTEFRIIRHDTGEVRYIHAVATIFRDEKGAPRRILGTNWDVSDERAREHALALALDNQRQLTRAAEAGQHAKSEFLAVMSHEIRTPMNGILGFAALLTQSSALNEEDRSSVETISRSGEALLRILDDVLDFSQIEAGGLVTKAEDFSPEKLVGEVRDFFLPAATAKGLTLQVHMAPDLPGIARSDDGRIRQILINLVSNAMKFTMQGTVTMKVRYVREVTGEGQLEVSVQDSGPGIAPSDRERIFDPFQQTDSSLSRSYGGTGLGLTISRRLAVLLGGTLEIEGSTDEGSCFLLRIPAPEGKGKAPALREPDRESLETDFARRHPLRILIVEDDRVNLRLVVNIIRKLGYDPKTAADGEEAVAYFKENGSDFILMDVQMPKMDGIEATKCIREIEAARTGSAVFICALTANVVPEDRQKCDSAGMNDFMSKPLRIPSLMNLLKATHKRKSG